jgi:hypothetical protein
MSRHGVLPFRHLDHLHDQPVPENPDPEKLQRLLGLLVDATSSLLKEPRYYEVRIRNFRSGRLKLVDDLIVLIEDYGDQFAANSYDTGQYGFGYSPDDAIQHLCSVLEDYYDLLLEDEGHLSPPLEAHLRYLEAILQER